MLENFIIFIQEYLILVSVLLFFQVSQLKKLVRLAGIVSFVLALGIIFALSIPNFFNKAFFDSGISFLLLVLLAFYFLHRIVRKHRDVEKFSLPLFFVLCLIMIQGILQIYNMIQGITSHGHHLTEKDSLDKIAGYLLGMLFLSFWIFGLKKASSTMSEQEKQTFLLWLLAVFMFQQLGSGLLWLYQQTIVLDWIPNLFKIISSLVNHDIWSIYLLLIVIVAFCWYLNTKQKSADPLLERSSADRRKKIAKARKNRRIITFLVIMMGIVLLSATLGKRQVAKEEVLSEPETYQTTETDVVLLLSEVSDGHLHRYEYTTTAGTSIRFIVIEKSEGSYGVGFDACEICGVSGYIERGDQIVCKLCDVVMNKATIGFKGGCNPIPLNYEIVGEHIIIHKQDLEEQESVFK